MSNKKAVARKEMSRWGWTWMMMKQYRIGYLMIAPFMIMFFIFTIIPVAASLLLSFTSYNMIQMPKFIFMQNYIQLFLTDELFIIALKNTMIFAIATGPGSYFISLITAWFLNELSPRARSIVTFIFYAPSISGNAMLVWTLAFSGDSYGYVNGWLMKLGIISEPILWFTNTKYILPLCIVVSLWMSLGTSFLAFIAGFQGINHDMYEAAAIDGIKNRWQELWYVTLPSMKPQLMFGAVMAITGAFNFGGVVESLAGNPTTDYCAYTLTMHLNEYSGVRWEVGYASAIAFIMFLLMFGSNMLIHKLLSKVGQ